MSRLARFFVLLLLALAAGCGRDDAPRDEGAIAVVATTQQVADFARQVGGDRVSVRALVPPNADPHDFEPRPSDARAVAEADVVLRSGGDIDAWLDGLLENAGSEAEDVTLIDDVETIAGGHAEEEHADEEHAGEEEHADEEVDPHWWQDPRNVVAATNTISRTFADADPEGRAAYEGSAQRYADEVTKLDERIASCVGEADADRRKLVTNHDSFGYFARRYDIEVLGSIVPALSTAAQPSAGDVRRLVAAIRRENVTTIFPESALDQRLEKAVARDAGVAVGDPLYADSLGPGEKGTYLAALRHDAQLIAESFGVDCAL